MLKLPRQNQRNPYNLRNQRSAFTLIELAIVIALICLVAAMYIVAYYRQVKQLDEAAVNSQAHMSYQTNIIKETEQNRYFRRVLFTGKKSQLVVMDIPAGGEIGEEIHKYTEQTLFFLSGTGKAILDGQESPVGAGDVVVVTPGTKHNFVNTGTSSLKVYTVYAPPNHIDGRIHATKAAADKDVQDEAFGEKMK